MLSQKVLKYCPELNAITGSVTASILMCQLEYWFEKTNDEPFYKFLEPCEDSCYKEGDSWTEELGFSAFEFRTAFSKIGVTYPSKTAYLKSKDPFQGKLYLSYRDRIKKRTYYLRNTPLVRSVLLSKHLPVRYTIDYKQTPYTQSLSQDKTSPIPYERIVGLFHQTCPSLPQVATLTKPLKSKIDGIWLKLKKMGKDALATLEEAFRKVQQSDFLCGRTSKSTWQAMLGWILQPKKFFDILGDKSAPFVSTSTCVPTYSNSPLRTNSTQRTKPLHTFLRMENHNFDLEHLEQLEQAYHWGRFHNKTYNSSPCSL